MSVTALPTPVPQTSDPVNFNQRADALMVALPTFVTEVNALQADVNAKQIVATQQADIAVQQAAYASSSSLISQSAANATLWVSGTTYAQGVTVISPLNVLTYRRKIAGAGTTDPSQDSTNWGPAIPGIVQNTNVTVSTTLTKQSMGIVSTKMTSIGQSITLPNATTLFVGGPLAVVDNSGGSYPVGVRDSSGKLIAGVDAGGKASLTLNDNSTTTGVWSVTGENLLPGLTTIDKVLDGYFSSETPATQQTYVVLDSNTSVHFVKQLETTSLMAFVVDSLGRVVSTPVAVTAGAYTGTVRAFKISNTSLIVFYSTFAVVLTLTGSSPNYNLSVGAAIGQPSTFNGWYDNDIFTAPQLVQLSPTLYICSAYNTSSSTSVIGISVSGTTITMSPTSVTVHSFASTSATGSATVYAIDANNALVLSVGYTGSTYAIAARVVNVSSSAIITVFGPTVLTMNVSAVGSAIPISAMLPNGKCVVVSNNGNSSQIQAQCLTITSSVVTQGPVLNLSGVNGGIVSGDFATYVSDFYNRFAPHLKPLSANTSLLSLTNGGRTSYATIITETSGSLAQGPVFYGTVSNSGSTLEGVGSIFPQGTSEFLSLVNGTSDQLYVIPNKISGVNITVGSSNAVPLNLYGGSTNYYNKTRLPNNKYIIANSVGRQGGVTVLQSNGDVVTNLGRISTPTILSTQCTPSIVADNRIVFIGRQFANVNLNDPLRLLVIEVV